MCTLARCGYYCLHVYGLCWIGCGGGDRAPLVAISPLIEEREQLDEDGLPDADYNAGSTTRTGDDLINLDPATGWCFYIRFVNKPSARDPVDTNFAND